MSADEILKNYSKALGKLDLFIDEPIKTERDAAGVIQAFEYTFEQFWKTCQKIAALEKIEARSPKQSLEAALTLDLIDTADEDTWLQMLEDRNMTSHTYNETVAQKTVTRIAGQYRLLFHKALLAMEKRLSD